MWIDAAPGGHGRCPGSPLDHLTSVRQCPANGSTPNIPAPVRLVRPAPVWPVGPVGPVGPDGPTSRPAHPTPVRPGVATRSPAGHLTLPGPSLRGAAVGSC